MNRISHDVHLVCIGTCRSQDLQDSVYRFTNCKWQQVPWLERVFHRKDLSSMLNEHCSSKFWIPKGYTLVILLVSRQWSARHTVDRKRTIKSNSFLKLVSKIFQFLLQNAYKKNEMDHLKWCTPDTVMWLLLKFGLKNLNYKLIKTFPLTQVACQFKFRCFDTVNNKLNSCLVTRHQRENLRKFSHVFLFEIGIKLILWPTL